MDGALRIGFRGRSEKIGQRIKYGNLFFLFKSASIFVNIFIKILNVFFYYFERRNNLSQKEDKKYI